MGDGASNTAAIGFGGSDPNASTKSETETWNGSAWTEVSDLGTGRYSGGGVGITTAALAVGGTPGFKGNTEVWNGSAWSEVADLSTARRGLTGSAGTSASAFAAGGQTASGTANLTAAVEKWSDPTLVIKTIDTD